MNKHAEVELGPAVPQRLVRALSAVPGIELHTGGAQAGLKTGGRHWPIHMVPRRPVTGNPEREAELTVAEARKAAKGALPLVLGTVLPMVLRRVLEKEGISYLDGRGGLHLVAPGLLLHVDQITSKPRTDPAETTSSIGQVSVRAVQLLLADPSREWKLTDLARQAVMSLGQAHKLFGLLDQEMLTKTTGKGPHKRRAIPQPGLLLDWLAAQPTSRRVYEQLECVLYARTVPALLARVSRVLDSEGLAHAWTGAAGAGVLKAGPTSVLRAALRVDPDRSLWQVAELLGAETAGGGANLVLWRDIGRVGVLGATRSEDGLPLAPPTRIYLDLLGERRGEDTAAHFREVALGF